MVGSGSFLHGENSTDPYFIFRLGYIREITPVWLQRRFRFIYIVRVLNLVSSGSGAEPRPLGIGAPNSILWHRGAEKRVCLASRVSYGVHFYIAIGCRLVFASYPVLNRTSTLYQVA